MEKTVNPRCPICDKPIDKNNDKDGDRAGRSFPFCSSRCQLVDLSNWIGERYAIPGEEVADPEPPDELKGPGSNFPN